MIDVYKNACDDADCPCRGDVSWPDNIADGCLRAPAKTDLLWVFDTQQYLEIFAPTRDEAEAKAAKVEEETGLDFVLDHEWEIRQEEHTAWMISTAEETER